MNRLKSTDTDKLSVEEVLGIILDAGGDVKYFRDTVNKYVEVI